MGNFTVAVQRNKNKMQVEKETDFLNCSFRNSRSLYNFKKDKRKKLPWYKLEPMKPNEGKKFMLADCCRTWDFVEKDKK